MSDFTNNFVVNNTPKKASILSEMRMQLRRGGYSYSTEKNYVDWVKRFIKHYRFQARDDLLLSPEDKVEKYLTYLAVQRNVAPATQNQALNALVFLYSKILKVPLEGVNASRSRKEPRIPVVLTKEEVSTILPLLSGTAGLIAKLLYASGLRSAEAVNLRVHDIDFGFKQITVRNGKGKKDRVTPLAESLIPLLKEQIKKVQAIHQKDLANGFGSVYLPHALEKKYPSAPYDFKWQYVFPSSRVSRDPHSNVVRRHHIDRSVINKAIKRALKQCGIHKRVSAHTFRHSFATHLLQDGTDIRTIQALLGHADLQTTMIYTHVLNQGGHGVKSPLDLL